jgi:hypothetical protein
MEQTATVQVPRLDAHLNRFSQGCVVLLTGVAFILNEPIVVVIAAIALALSALVPSVGPFRLLYRGVVLPLHLLQPRIVEDDPIPHRFAQAIGATFLIISSLFLLLTPFSMVGWILDLIVVVLAGINFTVGFCAGCFVYYQLGRLGVLPRVRYEGTFRWRGV